MSFVNVLLPIKVIQLMELEGVDLVDSVGLRD